LLSSHQPDDTDIEGFRKAGFQLWIDKVNHSSKFYWGCYKCFKSCKIL